MPIWFRYFNNRNFCTATNISSPVRPVTTPTILNGGSNIQTTHCRVINDGFDVSYALAWANICEVSYDGYKDIYGRDALALNDLDAIEVHLIRQSGMEPSLDSHGRKITFRGNETHLLSPADGGANNIYGICHEMGHLVFPIADSHYFEAWADYAAAFRIIPYVWDRLGAIAWPQPYDYLVNDGPTDLHQRIEDGIDKEDMLGDHYRAVSVLISVDDTYGPQIIGQAILRTEAPLKLNNFEEALISVTKDQSVKELFSKGH
ncbi:MAG: hypothetical protein JEZ06_12980 [Anaerolineaceae bacterium]|nr:hypothetical protein [Anaerolineaceae bacterium]